MTRTPVTHDAKSSWVRVTMISAPGCRRRYCCSDTLSSTVPLDFGTFSLVARQAFA
jgi:hypothetical protein